MCIFAPKGWSAEDSLSPTGKHAFKETRQLVITVWRYQWRIQDSHEVGSQPSREVPTYDFAKFSQKLDPKRGHVSKILLCISATGYVLPSLRTKDKHHHKLNLGYFRHYGSMKKWLPQCLLKCLLKYFLSEERHLSNNPTYLPCTTHVPMVMSAQWVTCFMLKMTYS